MRIEVTNKQFGIGFVFLVMTNTRAICRAYTQGVMVLCEGGRSARSNVSREESSRSWKSRHDTGLLLLRSQAT